MGAGLAGLTGVLLAPEGLDPVRLTLLKVPRFVAVVAVLLVSYASGLVGGGGAKPPNCTVSL